MDSKRGVYIIVAVVIVLLFGTLWVYDLFISTEPKTVKLGSEGKLLNTYVRENLLPEYVPEVLPVKQGLTSRGTEDGPNQSYGAAWTSNGAEARAFLQYTKDFTALSDLTLMFTINQTSELDSSSASSLLKTYFHGSYSPACSTIPNTNLVICEDFASGESVESGVSVIASPGVGPTLLFSCKRFKDSPFFGKGPCFGGGSR